MSNVMVVQHYVKKFLLHEKFVYLLPTAMFLFGQRDILQGTLQIEFFKLHSWSTGADFFPIANINLLNLKRRIELDFLNNFVIIKKRER